MSHKEFGPNDIFINRVKTHPEWDFFIYNSEVFINDMQNISGSLSDTYKGVPPGYLSLYEYNLNRQSSASLNIHPFLEVHGNYKTRFRKDLLNMLGSSKDGIAWNFSEGDIISSTYNMSASITRQFLIREDYVFQNDSTVVITHNHTASAIKNACLKYRTINPSFSNSTVSSLTSSGKSPLDLMFQNDVNMINIPSIFYGSDVKKGSVSLNYYITGSLIATAKDENKNGQLICTFGTGSVSGSVVGHILYDHGIIFFPKTGSANLSLDTGKTIKYDGTVDDAKWIYFGHGANEKNDSGALITPDSTHESASYSINFEGTTYKNTMTIFCHADKGELNFSNNPSYVNLEQTGSTQGFTLSEATYEDFSTDLVNIASSSFHKGEDEFRKVTYISKVGIYDEDNNLLMTADLARPYKKEEKDNFTFKIKYDLL